MRCRTVSQLFCCNSEMTSNDCPFCGIPQERVWIQGILIQAFPDAFPVSRGHMLVAPLRHVGRLAELSADEWAEVWGIIETVRVRLETELEPNGFNIGVNDGPAAGQTVDHVHFHVIPRYGNDTLDPRGGIRWVIPSKAAYWNDRV